MRALAMLSAIVLLVLSGCASTARVEALESQVKRNQSFAWDQWSSIERHTLEIEGLTTRLNKVAPLSPQDMTREQLLQLNGTLLKRLDSLKAVASPPPFRFGSYNFDTIVTCPVNSIYSISYDGFLECGTAPKPKN